jgi:hypothetical protein
VRQLERLGSDTITWRDAPKSGEMMSCEMIARAEGDANPAIGSLEDVVSNEGRDFRFAWKPAT